jgi:hypothetical protein
MGILQAVDRPLLRRLYQGSSRAIRLAADDGAGPVGRGTRFRAILVAEVVARFFVVVVFFFLVFFDIVAS